MRADLSGSRERLRAAAGRDPDGQLLLQRGRIDSDFNLLAVNARDLNRLAAPEFLHDLDAAIHLFVARAVLLREEDEIVRMPARGERDADASARQVIDDGPFFRDPERILKRINTLPARQLDGVGFPAHPA